MTWDNRAKAAYYRRWRKANSEKALASARKWKRKNLKKNPSYQAVASAKFRRERRLWYDGLKSGPCADCGYCYPPECMDWDHVRGRKTLEVGKLCDRATKADVLKEIAKCELVCANCHRTRTKRRARRHGRP